MRMQHAAVVQIDELVLAPSPHADDSRPAHRPPLGGLDATTQRRMMNHEIGDAAADDVAPKLDHCALYFGKLRNGCEGW